MMPTKWGVERNGYTAKYRVYDLEKPDWTIAYTDSLDAIIEESERFEVEELMYDEGIEA